MFAIVSQRTRNTAAKRMISLRKLAFLHRCAPGRGFGADFGGFSAASTRPDMNEATFAGRRHVLAPDGRG
jgi:hypothetical protein